MKSSDYEMIEYNGIKVNAIYYGEGQLALICLTDICKYFGRRIDKYVSTNYCDRSSWEAYRGKGGGTYGSREDADAIIAWCTYKPASKFRRLELDFLDVVEAILPSMPQRPLTLLRQYEVVSYRLDGYIPEWQIAIEYDEAYHKNKWQQRLDEDRQKAIIKALHGKVHFVRIAEGEEAEGLAEIIKLLLGKE
jgi:very-short-patch-repair endonuclease